MASVVGMQELRILLIDPLEQVHACPLPQLVLEDEAGERLGVVE